jgi:hypothetical protein
MVLSALNFVLWPLGFGLWSLMAVLKNNSLKISLKKNTKHESTKFKARSSKYKVQSSL